MQAQSKLNKELKPLGGFLVYNSSTISFFLILFLPFLTLLVACEKKETIKDERDGKTYKIVRIGEQVWMAQNLNYNAKFSKCFENKDSNCAKYGRLYNWATIMDLPVSCNNSNCSDQVKVKHKGICPSGWHIPSNDEWVKLVNYAGGDSVAGNKLKAKSGWEDCCYDYSDLFTKRIDRSCIENNTDDYGFSVLPNGIGNRIEPFYYSYTDCISAWWSASEMIITAVYELIIFKRGELYNHSKGKKELRSVRCVKD